MTRPELKELRALMARGDKLVAKVKDDAAHGHISAAVTSLYLAELDRSDNRIRKRSHANQ